MTWRIFNETREAVHWGLFQSYPVRKTLKVAKLKINLHQDQQQESVLHSIKKEEEEDGNWEHLSYAEPNNGTVPWAF